MLIDCLRFVMRNGQKVLQVKTVEGMNEWPGIPAVWADVPVVEEPMTEEGPKDPMWSNDPR